MNFIRSENMNILKLTLAAATFSVALAASASAMPVGNIGGIDTGINSAQPEQVRLVCNQWGRCWRTGGYVYRGGWRGGRGGWRGHGGGHGGHGHHH
jgi:hypothetical protein